MSKIQKELARIQQELKAPKSEFNSFGKYSYRTIDLILTAVKPHLNGCSIILSDSLVDLSTGVYVEGTASLLLDGDVISANGYAKEAEKQGGMSPPQLTGSSSTYARKLALSGLLAIDDGQDDDATNTHGKGEKPSKPNTPKSKITPKQTIEIIDLASKAGLDESKQKQARDFANSDKTTEENATAFIVKLKEMVDEHKHKVKKTPKEKLIDELINDAMVTWGIKDEDQVVSQLIVKLKVNSLSNATVDAMKKLRSGITDGSVVPF